MAGAFEEVAPARPVVTERPSAPRTSVEAAPARAPVPDLMSTLSKLKSVSSSPPGVTDKETAPPGPKRTFTPGPSEPASGMRVDQILKNPVTVKALAAEIEKWEADNPGRKLKGPAVAEMVTGGGILPDITGRQAAAIARKIEAERARMAMGEDAYKSGRAAASAMRTKA